MKIGELFSEDINRRIEEVIKVDDLQAETLLDELREYYPTASIQEQLLKVLRAYDNLRREPTTEVGVWISGFFGAGKSSFAKLLGLLLEDHKVDGESVIDLFSARLRNDEIKVLLGQIRKALPTTAVIFDILKDHIAGAKEHPVTTVMYKALLRRFGYAQDLDLAELECNLEEQKRLEAFKAKYAELYPGRNWDDAKRLVMTAVNEASRTLHELERPTYPAVDTWAKTRAHAEISARKLAERALQIANARGGGRRILFVVDEIGQYVARDLGRIGDLQGVVESFSEVGRGKLWLTVTSQEKLEAVVDIFDKDKSELVRLQDRFKHRVTLSQGDIREVASRRVLAKKSAGEAALREQFQKHSGKLKGATRLSAAINLPALEEDTFVNLYPLLPYQVDLLISVVSGLRRQASGPQTMGGGSRTMIRLAQQLLVNPSVGLASREVGALVTLDSVYKLLETSLAGEMQREIEDIERQVEHPLAGPVAKALALLQFAEAVHTTEDNLAAVLHPAIDGLSRRAEVVEAVEKLLAARKIRRTEHGLKIQSAAERTWDEERDGRRPYPADRTRALKGALEELWGRAAQAPNHKLGGWRQFTGGLKVGPETLVEGDVLFDVRPLDAARPTEQQIQDARAVSQKDTDTVVWTVVLSDKAEEAIVEAYRSQQMTARPLRSPEEEALHREESRRLKAAQATLREELSQSLCRGKIFVAGNDRSPAPEATDPKFEARRVLSGALEAMFHKFSLGNVRVTDEDVAAIMKSDSLTGLPACYATLKLVQTVEGQTRLTPDDGAAKEIAGWIRGQCEARQAPSGRELEHHFRGAPYGWSLELLQLMVATLLRAGQITVTGAGQTIKSAQAPEAKREIQNNTRFRALTIRVREGGPDAKRLREAARALEERFGHKVQALTASSIAAALREKVCAEQGEVEGARQLLRDLQLPGEEALTQALNALRLVADGDDDEAAVLVFLESADKLAKALPRARATNEIVGRAYSDLERALQAHRLLKGVLEQELPPGDPVQLAVQELGDRLAKETFYEELPEVFTAAQRVLDSFASIYGKAFAARTQAHRDALDELEAEQGWSDLGDDLRASIAKPLLDRVNALPPAEPWRDGAMGLNLCREQARGAAHLLEQAREAVRRAVAPEALVLSIRQLVAGPIRSSLELDKALEAIREAAAPAVAEGRPVVLR